MGYADIGIGRGGVWRSELVGAIYLRQEVPRALVNLKYEETVFLSLLKAAFHQGLRSPAAHLAQEGESVAISVAGHPVELGIDILQCGFQSLARIEYVCIIKTGLQGWLDAAHCPEVGKPFQRKRELRLSAFRHQGCDSVSAHLRGNGAPAVAESQDTVFLPGLKVRNGAGPVPEVQIVRKILERIEHRAYPGIVLSCNFLSRHNHTCPLVPVACADAVADTVAVHVVQFKMQDIVRRRNRSGPEFLHHHVGDDLGLTVHRTAPANEIRLSVQGHGDGPLALSHIFVQGLFKSVSSVIHESVDLSGEVFLDIGLDYRLNPVGIFIHLTLPGIGYIIAYVIEFRFDSHRDVRSFDYVADIEVHLRYQVRILSESIL